MTHSDRKSFAEREIPNDLAYAIHAHTLWVVCTSKNTFMAHRQCSLFYSWKALQTKRGILQLGFSDLRVSREISQTGRQ